MIRKVEKRGERVMLHNFLCLRFEMNIHFETFIKEKKNLQFCDLEGREQQYISGTPLGPIYTYI